MENNGFEIKKGIFEKYAGPDTKVLEIPEGVTEIASWSLRSSNLKGCEKIIFPSTLKKVEGYALNWSYGVSALEELEFLGDIDVIGREAFDFVSSYDSGKLGIKVLTFRGKVGKIEAGAFRRAKIKKLDIPMGVGEIGKYAFRECMHLEEIHLPGLKKIGNDAFWKCTNLQVVDIPAELTNIGSEAFKGCEKLRKDGLIIVNGIVFDKAMNPVIPEGVFKLDSSIVYVNEKTWRAMYSTYQLPSTIRTIEEQGCFGKMFKMPPNLLQTDEKLGGQGMLSQIENYWKPSKMDWAAMYLFQSGKQFEDMFAKYMKKPYDEYLKHMITLLEEKGKAKNFVKAAEFVLEHSEEVSLENIQKLHDISVQNKAKKAVELLAPFLKSEDSATSVNSETIEDPYAVFRNAYNEHLLDNTIKKNKGIEKLFKGVKLKDGTEAPVFLVKCAIVPYLAQFLERPKHISGYKRDYTKVEIVSLADEAAKMLDTVSLQEALENMRERSSAWLLPYGRFASAAQISKLISEMKAWEAWYTYGSKGRSDIIIARGALMLSDTREAMMNIDKTGLLEYYAELRGMDDDVIRDTVLSEFGLDENGKKVYNLGTKTVVISLESDLTLSLFDQEANKIIKSIPKKGTDPGLVAIASADFAEMKKNAKKVVKGRNDILFADFLSGQTRNAVGWLEAYTKNPLLRQIAKLIVWNQKENTFIMTDNGPIDCTGAEYKVKKNTSVGVAHPIEMTKEQIEAWQKYFTSNDLKQPFVQIWEPAIAPDTVKEDRYKDCMIPFQFLRGQAKHGITVEDYDFHNEINVFLEDCDADVERITWKRHEINNDDLFEVTSFGFKKYTRQVNHIVAYLDRVTVYGRVLDNDSSIVEYLDNFTLAQIVEFINVAMENQSNDCLAILMDYKEKKFTEFDPMDMFTLD